MPDLFLQIRLSEIKPVYASVSTSSGTIIVSSATYGIVDNAGAVKVAAGTACTGFDTGPQTTARAWVTLTPTISTLAAGNSYSLTIKIVLTGSDNIARTEETVIWLYVNDDVS